MTTGTKIDQTIRCATCNGYLNPQQWRDYPNGKPNIRWATCAAGNTINNLTRACGLHDCDGEAIKMPADPTGIMEAPEVKPTRHARPKVEAKAVMSELLGGIDYDNILKDEIEKIGVKA